MRKDILSEFDEKIIEEQKKEVPEDSDYAFSPAQLNQFFNHPVWIEIDNILKFRQMYNLQQMLDADISVEESNKRKGQFVEIVFTRGIRNVLEPEQEDKEYDIV